MPVCICSVADWDQTPEDLSPVLVTASEGVSSYNHVLQADFKWVCLKQLDPQPCIKCTVSFQINQEKVSFFSFFKELHHAFIKL